jgi:hypothetical protein
MKQILKNKKAILMPEVLRIILAVLCLIALIMLAVQLYSIFTRSNDLEQAKATLNEILAKAAVLDESGKHTDLLILSPGKRKGGDTWKIVAYPDTKELCICPIVSGITEKQACQQQGTCQKRDYVLDILDVKGISLSEATLPLELTLFNQGGIIKLKAGKFDYLTAQNKDGTEEFAITPASASIKEIILKDSLQPSTTAKLGWDALASRLINDPTSLRINYVSSGNYIDISMFSIGSQYYSSDIVGRIYSDGSVWLSAHVLIPLTASNNNLFANLEEYNRESLIIYGGTTERPVDSKTKIPVSNSETMKYVLVNINKLAGSTPQNYNVHRALFKTNLNVNFEEVKSRSTYLIE